MSESAELDRTARQVIDAGREAPAPSERAAERIRRAVALELAGTASRTSTRSSKGRTITKVLLATFAVALGIYAAERTRSSKSEANPPVIAARATAPRPALSAVSAASLPGAVGAAPAAPTSVATTPSSAAAVDAPENPSSRVRANARLEAPQPRSQQLAAEIELLARVNSAVNAGDGTRALALLREYDRRFAPGILAEERAAASVLSLCANGRKREGRSEGERFARRWPRSPLVGRVEASCAGSK